MSILPANAFISDTPRNCDSPVLVVSLYTHTPSIFMSDESENTGMRSLDFPYSVEFLILKRKIQR